MAEVRIEGVTKRFGDVVAVDEMNLVIDDQEFFSLLGPSGCGKTTLLNLIAGLEELAEGRIYIGGEEVTHLFPKDRGVAMVFQDFALYPHMTVFQNLEFPLKAQRVASQERRDRVEEAAEVLGIEQLLHRLPRELSGGQRQRVALGRALVRSPKVFLMDEPLSNLDARLRVEMRRELERLHRRLGVTTIYVTHDQVEAMTLSDRMAVMSEGVLQQVGPPKEVYDQPANRFVANFLGLVPMTQIEGRAIQRSSRWVFVSGDLEVPLPGRFQGAGGLREGQAVCLGIHPEHLLVSREEVPGALEARLDISDQLGSDQYLILDVAGHTFVSRVAPDFKVEQGARLFIRCPEDRVYLFDEESGFALSSEVSPEPGSTPPGGAGDREARVSGREREERRVVP